MPNQSTLSPTLFAVPGVPERDKDAEFKLRTARYLWHMGYVCPTEVAVSGNEIRAGALKRYNVTDIDVVGIKFEDDLTWHSVVADCKSGKSNSGVNRLFWLRGIMDFFKADHGYLVQPSIGREAREVALRLSISLLDNENLRRSELDKRLAEDGRSYFALEAYDAEKQLAGLRLPKGSTPNEEQKLVQLLGGYLSYTYWFQEEYRNIQHLIRMVTDASKPINELTDRRRAKVLAYRALTLWSISVLKMVGYVIATRSGEIHNEVRRYIFGGSANAAERGRLMHIFADLTKQPLALEPAYYPELLELTSRLIRYSQFAKNVPRYSDLVYAENVICQRTESIEAILTRKFDLDTLKLTKDVAEFICKATGLDKDLYEDLMTQ